ncbi:MAG: hypothetical protein GXX10_08545 [Clostridiaceae bacterium]|nr:hypothetical protein [Clostridiaceae bacterium]
MGNLLKVLSCIMLSVLIGTQLLLFSPYRGKLTDDTLNGRVLNTYEAVMHKGVIILDGLGEYQPNSATVLINGTVYKTIDSFPVELTVYEGDVVEVKLKLDASPLYVFLASIKGDIRTDLTESTVLIKPGINRILKIFAVPGKE